MNSQKKKTLIGEVEAILKTGEWTSLGTIAEVLYHDANIKASPRAIGAAIRDLRKPSRGGYVIDSKQEGLWLYRMAPPRTSAADLKESV